MYILRRAFEFIRSAMPNTRMTKFGPKSCKKMGKKS